MRRLSRLICTKTASKRFEGVPAAFAGGNLLTDGQDLSGAAWTRTALTGVTPEAILSPYEIGGDLMIESSTSAAHQLSQSISWTTGTTYRMAVIAKPKGRNVQLVLPASAYGSAVQARFDLSAGTATQVTGTSAPQITYIGAGFYLCEHQAQATASASGFIIIRALNGTTGSYLGDGSSGLYIVAASVSSVA